MPEPELRVRDHAGGWRPVRDLDPGRTTSRRGGRVAPTRYVANRLLVRGRLDGDDAVVAAVRERAQARGLSIEEVAMELASSRDGDNPLYARPGVAFHVTAGSDSAGDGDVWSLMDEVAEMLGDEDRSRVSLDHVVVGHRYGEGHGVPGSRLPVQFSGPAPRREYGQGQDVLATSDGVRRPVVAVLDSGIGVHPWFDDQMAIVLRGATLDGEPLGTGAEDEPLYDAEVRGRRRDRAELLDAYAGHGTFIAGVVHQVCPDAVILPVRIFGGDGRVTEWDLAHTLEKLLEFHLRGVAGQVDYHPVDVAVLSAGFYAEHPEDDDDYDGILRGRLRDLRRAGVLVVLSAGNDGSARPNFPAAWSPRVRRLASGVVLADSPGAVCSEYPPLLTVTAANPDGTLASFSNDGAWVTAVRPGANVVSTMPTTFDGAVVPWESGDGLRQAVDADNFASGFGMWSGTSFAAPVLAGELALALLRHRTVGRRETGVAPSPAITSRVADAWAAVTGVGDLYNEVPAAVM